MNEKTSGLRRVSFLCVLVGALAVAGCGKGEQPASVSEPGKQVIETRQATATAPIPAPPDVAAIPEGAERSESGLAWKVLEPGSGSTRPARSSQVEVHYTGWTTDGQMFDSSRVRGATAAFRVDRVIAGWTEGLQLMVEGEQRRFWIPPELAYKNSTRPGAPQGMLVFDVELIAIRD